LNPTTADRDLTSFVEDAAERSYQRLNVVSLPSSLDAQVIAGSDLQKFFERPVSIINTEWLQSAVENDIIFDNSIGSMLEGNTMWSQKFAGFRYCRGTAVIRVQINPMPFHQGRLLIHFLPFVASMPPRYEDMHNWCLGTKTAQPSVELDCRDGVAELHIPYIAPTQYYDLVNNVYDWGKIYITVLSPLLSPDAQSVEYTVWLSFKDFELAGPIVPQGPNGMRKSKSRATRIGASESEKSKTTQKGVLEASAHAVSGLANALSGVPMLSSVMAPVSWMAGAVGKVAGLFGWSKPTNEQPTTVILSRYAHGMTHSIGHDMAEPLSYYSDPSLQVSDGFAGSNVDEMSFAYLKTFDTFGIDLPWSVTDPAGTSLYNIPLTLSNIGEFSFQNLGPASYEYLAPPPMITIAKKFRYYRGGIRVVLKFIKTQYHSGRLAVTFMPGATTTSAATTSSSYILREIVDMRDSNELVLELPFIFNKPYITFEEVFGRLQIIVLNELRAPPAVVSSIKILMYFGVADDFEVSVPEPSQQRSIIPQGGDLLPSSLVAAKVIGGANTGSVDFARPALCVGEAIVSLKQIMLRYQRLYRDAGSFTVGGLWPFTFTAPLAISSLTPAPPQYGGDYLNDIALGFALYRGGMRLMYMSDKTSVLSNQPATCLRPFEGGNNTYDTTYVSDSISPTIVLSNNVNGLIEYQHSGQLENVSDCPNHYFNVTVPYYNNFPSSLVYCRYNGSATVPADESQPPYGISWTTTGTVPSSGKVYRACADDFQFGYFIGFLPQLLNIGTI